MLFLTILLVAIIVVVATLSFIKTSSPKRTYTVVIDAGHGGIDGGSVGVVTKMMKIISTLNMQNA